MLSDFCFCYCIGGDKEIRTPDPLLARQVLSQLSYTPTLNLSVSIIRTLKIKQCINEPDRPRIAP